MSTELTTQEVSNISWALAKLWIHHMPLLYSVAAQSIATVHELNRQELSMTAWAFATLSIHHEPLLAAISEQAILRISDFGMLEVSNLSWAFARSTERNDALMAAICEQALNTLDRSDVHLASGGDQIANPHGAYALVWSSWKAGWPELSWALFERPPPGPEASSHETMVY